MTTWREQIDGALEFLSQPAPPKYWDNGGVRSGATSTAHRWIDWIGPDEITVVQAAQAYEIAPATVRQWVKRGHLAPQRYDGRRMIFDAQTVNDTFHRVSQRATPREVAARGIKDPLYRGPVPCSHVTSSELNQVVPLSRAADITHIPLPTLRSWHNRGHLKPLRTEGGTKLFKIADVVTFVRTPREKRPKNRRVRLLARASTTP